MMGCNATLLSGISSSSSWRVRICLAVKNIAFTPVWFDSAQVDGLPDDLSPMRQVPVLRIDGLELRQSVAICEYLDHTRPTSSPLLPKNNFGYQAKVREVVETINSGIQPLQNSPVVQVVSQDEWKRKEWVTHFLLKGLSALERIAEEEHSGKLFFPWSGESPTMAEVFLIPQVFNGMRYGVDVEGKFPRIFRIFRHCMENVKGFKETMPKANL